MPGLVALVPIDNEKVPTDSRKIRLCGALSYLRYECITVSPPPKWKDSPPYASQYDSYVACCAQALTEMLSIKGDSPLTNGEKELVACFLRPTSIIPLQDANDVRSYLLRALEKNKSLTEQPDQILMCSPSNGLPCLVAGHACAVRDALVKATSNDCVRFENNACHNDEDAAALCAVVSDLSELGPASATSKNPFHGDHATSNGDSGRTLGASARRTPALVAVRATNTVPAFVSFNVSLTSGTRPQLENLENLWDAMYDNGTAPQDKRTQIRKESTHDEARHAEQQLLGGCASSTRTKRIIAQRKAQNTQQSGSFAQHSSHSRRKRRDESALDEESEQYASLKAQLPSGRKELIRSARHFFITEPSSRLTRVALQEVRKRDPVEATRLQTLLTAWRSGLRVKQRDLRMLLRQTATDRLRPAIAAHNRELEKGIRDVSDRRYAKRRDRALVSTSARLRAHEEMFDVGTRGRWSLTRLTDKKKQMY